MKYAILIHSNPEPWGHPTQLFTAEGRAQPQQWHEEGDREFTALMEEISASGAGSLHVEVALLGDALRQPVRAITVLARVRASCSGCS